MVNSVNNPETAWKDGLNSAETMTFFKQCLCFSLLTGAVLTGVYATAVYIVAFAMEVWLITEAPDQLPTPSYILCISYFFTWIGSVGLLVGLALRRTKPMLAWILIVVVCFFPECGLVLFMSLYHWTLDSSFGSSELVFWIFRALFNIVGVLCVYSLYSEWRAEKSVNRRLRDLTMTTSIATGGYYSNAAVIKTPLPGSLRAGYHNAAFISSEMNLRHIQHQQQQQTAAVLAAAAATSTAAANRQRVQRMVALQRSTSSLSQISLGSRPGNRFSHRITSEDDYNDIFKRWPHNNGDGLSKNNKMLAGMAFGSMGIAGVGLNEPESVFFVDETDNYLNRAPLSRTVSMANFCGPAFDRQSQFVTGGSAIMTGMRRSHSMNDLYIRIPSMADPGVMNNRLFRIDQIRHRQPQPFSYVPTFTTGHHRGSLGAESDEFQRLSYKDVAL